MRILIVGIFAELIDLAIHLQDEGHDVYYYIDRKDDKEIGKGLIKLVKGWKQLAEEADLIIFPDVYFGDLPLKYREKGKLVIGGSALSDRLENDREFATKIYDRFGLKYPKTWHFTSFNEAIEFVKKNPDRYVLKPMGQKPRFYTYVAEDDEDMIVALKHFKDIWPGKSDFILQEYVEGVEIACTGFFNGEKFLKPFIVNFEEKRIGEGNRGPSSGEAGTTLIPQMKCKLAQQTIQKLSPFLKLADFRGEFDLNCILNDDGIWILEATCFPESTQIQTLDGWKGPNDLQIGDLALTLNLKTNKIEYHPVENILVFKYDGPICVFGNNYLEFATTPDHDILHITGDRYIKTKAQNLLGKKIKPVLSAEKDGLNKDIFELPPVTDGSETLAPPLSIETEDLLYFLGLYIADGWHDAGRVYLRRQYRPEITAKILKRLENFPFPIDKIENWIVIRSIQLVNFLDQLGFERGNNIFTRLIPPFLFEFSSELLYDLVEGLCDGDGCASDDGRRFYTASRELAEQVAMIYLYLGLSPSISMKRNQPPLYAVYGASPDIVSKGFKVEEDYYKGYVWCPVVPPHHTILARVDHRPFFNFQCRPGIPTMHIIDGLMEGEWGETLADIASGSGSVIPLREEWCVGVVMMSPPWPYEMKTDKYSDFPLSFPWRLVEKHLIHPGDIKAKLVDDQVLLTTAGNVGFTLVATGSGRTIDDAQRVVYNKVLPKVKFSLGWYRTDIGDRVKKKLGYLKKMGYL